MKWWITLFVVLVVAARNLQPSGIAAEAEKAVEAVTESAAVSAEASPSTTEDADESPFRAAPQADLDAVQGLWERTEKSGFFSSQRLTKQIRGDSETVTTHDSSGNVVSEHTVKIRLGRAGPIRVFLYSGQEFTEGPQAGTKLKGTQAYVYKVVGDTFVEIWGVLGDRDNEIRVLRWQRRAAAPPG
jgi:hypothetical protein